MEAIDLIIEVIAYLLFLVIFMITVVGGFIQPALAAQAVAPILPWFLFFLGLAIFINYGLPILEGLGALILNGIGFIVTHFLTIVGSGLTFIMGLGDAALLTIQAWGEAILATLAGWGEAGLALFGFSITTGHWVLELAFDSISVVFWLLLDFLSFMPPLIYGLASVVFLLLNFIAFVVSSGMGWLGSGPVLQTLAAGSAALLALPLLVKGILMMIAWVAYLISLIALRLTQPIWQASWLFGWVVKMLVTCFSVVFLLDTTSKPSFIFTWHEETDQWKWAPA